MLHVQIKNAADSEAAGEETSTSGAKGQSDSQHPEVVFSEDGWVTVGKKRREKDKRHESAGDQEEEAIGNLKTVHFSSGNPRMESRSGVVHLFRNVEESPESLKPLPVSPLRIGWQSKQLQGAME